MTNTVAIDNTRSVLTLLAHSLVGRCMHNIVQWISVYLNFPQLRMLAGATPMAQASNAFSWERVDCIMIA